MNKIEVNIYFYAEIKCLLTELNNTLAISDDLEVFCIQTYLNTLSFGIKLLPFPGKFYGDDSECIPLWSR